MSHDQNGCYQHRTARTVVLRRLGKSGQPSMQTGRYFGLVKHAEQVRYVPRRHGARTPFLIDFRGIFRARSALYG